MEKLSNSVDITLNFLFFLAFDESRLIISISAPLQYILIWFLSLKIILILFLSEENPKTCKISNENSPFLTILIIFLLMEVLNNLYPWLHAVFTNSLSSGEVPKYFNSPFSSDTMHSFVIAIAFQNSSIILISSSKSINSCWIFLLFLFSNMYLRLYETSLEK